MTYFPGNEGKSIMRKFVLFLCCLVSLLLICSCGKRKIDEQDKNRLFSLYSKLYHVGDPVKIDAMSDQILSDASKYEQDADLQFLMIHAYNAKAFVANLRKEKKLAVNYLETAESLLPILKDRIYNLKSKCDIYFIYYQILKDHPDQAEKWLVRLEELIAKEMSSYEYKHGSEKYKQFLHAKYGENTFLRADFLVKYKNDLASAEKILLTSLEKQEIWAGNDPFLSQIYGYDLLSEIYFRNKNDKACSFYAEKSICLAVKLNQLPLYAPLHYYAIKMKQHQYESALSCCKKILDMDLLNDADMSHSRKDFLTKAAAACRKMKDFKEAERYQSQADKIVLQPEIGNQD